MSISIVYDHKNTEFDPETDEYFVLDARHFYNGKDLSDEERTQIRRTTFKGCVLRTGEHNWYDDSDFYALVWNPDKKRIEEIPYASTRHAGIGRADVDVSEGSDVWHDAVDWLRDKWFSYFIEQHKAELASPLKNGRVVKSLYTSGAKVGVIGEVRWYGPNKFRTYYANGYNKATDFAYQVVGVRKIVLRFDGTPFLDVNGRVVIDPDYPKLIYLDAPKVETILIPDISNEDTENIRAHAEYEARQLHYRDEFLR